MADILANTDDINTHLPTDKIAADDALAEDAIALIQVDTARLIRSMLSGTFTAVQLAVWVSPATTPDLIRGIAGRLIAAKHYATRYAEDSDESTYAQSLYNEAIAMLADIRNGNLIVVGSDMVPLTVTGTGLDSDD